MSKNSLQFLLTLLGGILLFGFMSCDDDEMPSGPVGGDVPVANFTVAASGSSTLTIDFTNTSTGGTSYSWNFGDGNTSTETSPSHAYAASGTYQVSLTATNAAGNNSKTMEVVVASPYHASGYVLSSVVLSNPETYYAGYFPELPSGDVDMTQFQAFPFFYARATHGGFMYGAPRDNTDFGVVRYAVDASTNQIVEVDRITRLQRVTDMVIVNDELGFFSGFRYMTVTAFNPSTMQVIREIDLAANTMLPTPPEGDVRGVAGMLHNPVTGKLICMLNYNDFDTPQFYDLPDTYVDIIDVNTLAHEGSSVQPNATYPIFRGEDNSVIDDNGNLYIIAAGSYGLDGQVGPGGAASSKPQILKINASNSRFDTDYAWNPVNAAGFQNNFFQLFTALVDGTGNKAYGIGTAGSESPRILELLQIFAAGQLTPAQFDELRLLVFTEESQRIMEVDLVNRTIALVDNAPFTAGYAYPSMYNYDDIIYSQMISNGGTFNGFYSINQETGTAAEQVKIAVGGVASQLIKLDQ